MFDGFCMRRPKLPRSPLLGDAAALLNALLGEAPFGTSFRVPDDTLGTAAST